LRKEGKIDDNQAINLTIAGYLDVPGDWRRRESPRITIRWVLGAPRLTTSGCSRLRA
jgi:hypothetical protein